MTRDAEADATNTARPAELSDREIRRAHALPDDRLAALPLVSEHGEPQAAPQEYECGCVTVARVTDRDVRLGGRPFEMRLARSCARAGGACELAGPSRARASSRGE